jgi:hypothetical protein
MDLDRRGHDGLLASMIAAVRRPVETELTEASAHDRVD